jgi:DNA invertase Pin-like site-specific DNA recombinase
MNIGYARVSTDDQHPENQIEELVKAGCDRNWIYQDTASGGAWERPQLHEALKHLRPGDTLIFWKLDRLSRSLTDLLKILEVVNKAGAAFKSLTEPLDTTTAIGRMHMQIIGTFAEFERAMIRERTDLGLKRAKANGKTLGPRFLLTPAQQADVVRQIRSGEKTQSQAAIDHRVSKATITRLMHRERRKEYKKMGVAA